MAIARTFGYFLGTVGVANGLFLLVVAHDGPGPRARRVFAYALFQLLGQPAYRVTIGIASLLTGLLLFVAVPLAFRQRS